MLTVVVGLATSFNMPAALSRRAALAGAAGLMPAAASAAANPLAADSFSGYKTRDYGNGENTSPGSAQKTKVTSCPEGQRLSPDGFGGKTCKGQVKSVAATVSENLFEGDSSPKPPPTPPPLPKAKAAKEVATSRSSSSSPALTFEDLLANSIKQKEALLGTELSAAEKADLSDKLRALMSK